MLKTNKILVDFTINFKSTNYYTYEEFTIKLEALVIAYTVRKVYTLRHIWMN